ncbi:nucleotidyltransferase family protein [Bacillus cereus]|uniref:nucleotidyltransferase family protein n=1 Tax=Bacillus cereus TaxID=1396 RepID=UPI002ED8529D
MTDTIIKQAVILAAGQGSRMNVTDDVSFSKAMAPILNKPLVTFIIDAILNAGINEIVIVKKDNDRTIENIVHHYGNQDVRFTFISDDIKNGSLTSFYFVKEAVEYPFLLVDCDLILNANKFPSALKYAVEKYEDENKLFGLVSVVSNPIKADKKMLRVANGKALEFNKKGFEDGRIGGMIYIFFSNPFLHCKHIIDDGVTSFAFFFNRLILAENFGVMEVEKLWDVDTLEDIKLTENLLLGGIL